MWEQRKTAQSLINTPTAVQFILYWLELQTIDPNGRKAIIHYDEKPQRFNIGLYHPTEHISLPWRWLPVRTRLSLPKCVDSGKQLLHMIKSYETPIFDEVALLEFPILSIDHLITTKMSPVSEDEEGYLTLITVYLVEFYYRWYFCLHKIMTNEALKIAPIICRGQLIKEENIHEKKTQPLSVCCIKETLCDKPT